MKACTQQQQEWTRSSQQLGDEFGVSHATIERVRTILEQIQSLRDRSETGEGPGVRVEDVSKKFTRGGRQRTSRGTQATLSVLRIPGKAKDGPFKAKEQNSAGFFGAQKAQDNTSVSLSFTSSLLFCGFNSLYQFLLYLLYCNVLFSFVGSIK